MKEGRKEGRKKEGKLEHLIYTSHVTLTRLVDHSTLVVFYQSTLVPTAFRAAAIPDIRTEPEARKANILRDTVHPKSPANKLTTH